MALYLFNSSDCHIFSHRLISLHGNADKETKGNTIKKGWLMTSQHIKNQRRGIFGTCIEKDMSDKKG
jgi:hypothetical protein